MANRKASKILLTLADPIALSRFPPRQSARVSTKIGGHTLLSACLCLRIPTLHGIVFFMKDSVHPDPNDKNSTWKSLAGNLFGIEFDDQAIPDDLDLDAVADAVEQLAPQETPSAEQPAQTVNDEILHGWPDEKAKAVTSSTSTPAEAVNICSPAAEVPQQTTEKKSVRRKPQASTQRSSYDDEDLFGFGIIDQSSEEEAELEEDDDEDEVLEGSPVARSEIREVEPVALEPEASVEEELTLEDFDFEQDLFEEPPPRPKSRPAEQSRAPEPTRSEVPAPPPESGKRKTTADDDDDFWSSLEDWDVSQESSRKPRRERPERSSEGRRERPTRAVRSEVEEHVEQVEKEVAPARSRSEETRTEDSPTSEGDSSRKRPRRRRRRGRDRESVATGESATSPAREPVESEIDPEIIDRLWNENEEEEVDRPVASPKVAREAEREPRRISREDRGNARRGQRETPRSETPVAEIPPAPRTEIPSDIEVVDDIGDSEASARKYKSVPTWSEAIGMIVRRRDPEGNRGRGRREAPRRDSAAGETSRSESSRSEASRSESSRSGAESPRETTASSDKPRDEDKRNRPRRRPRRREE